MSRIFNLNLHLFKYYRKSTNSQIVQCIRFCSSNHNEKFFITTPIFYVNGAPHIGHLYSAVLADAIARWSRLQGLDVFFTTGTDEHGLKIYEAATLNGQQPKRFCDDVSSKFKNLFNLAGISNDDYIRTTESRHKETVQQFWRNLEMKGYIYRGGYEGWYSISDEEFVGKAEVTDGTSKDGKPCKISINSGHPVVWTKEENYMFKLGEFKSELHKWLDTKVIHPYKFEKIVRSWIDNMSDLSISRPTERLSWGIPVPDDDSQTIYVWLDALVNYYTCAQSRSMRFWPPDIQIVGQDILRFHAVIWPALLIASDLPLPRKILCHCHWLVDDVKMSKSLGNVVDPVQNINKYSSEAYRYFLLKEGVPHSNCNYTESRVVETINTDLVNTLGNLLSRCTSKSLNPHQVIPVLNESELESRFSQEDRNMFLSIYNLAGDLHTFYTDGNIYKVLQLIMKHLNWANMIFQDHQPWKLRKNNKETDYLNCLLHMMLETLRVTAILMQPVIPIFSSNTLDRLNVLPSERTVNHSKLQILTETKNLGEYKGVLLKRIKD